MVDGGARAGESCVRCEVGGGKFNARESDDGGPYGKSRTRFRALGSCFLSMEVIEVALEEDNHCCSS